MAKAQTTNAGARGQRDHAYVFGISMAASAVLHVCALLVLAGIPLRELPQVEPLQVTLEKTEPPQVIQTTPKPSPPARPAPQMKVEPQRKEKPPPTADAPPRPTQAEPPPPSPAPVLTVPAAPVTSAPFTAAVPETPSEAPAATARAEPGVARTESPAADKRAVATPGVGAMYTHSPKPVYPLSAQRRGEEGTVIVLVLVTRTGLPENVSVEKTSGYRGLDEAAVAAIKTWRFKPAREGSQTVDSWVRIPVVFRIEGPS